MAYLAAADHLCALTIASRKTLRVEWVIGPARSLDLDEYDLYYQHLQCCGTARPEAGGRLPDRG